MKEVGDSVALTVTVATVLQILPAVAALFAIVWYGIGYYEKVTGKPFSESTLARWIRGAK